MSEVEVNEPPRKDDVSRETGPNKHRRRTALALVVATVTLAAAWWCFGPTRPVRIPGTVSVTNVERGHRVVAAASSAESGDAMYVYSDDMTVGEFRSEQWEPISLTSPFKALAVNEVRLYDGNPLLTSPDGRALLQDRSGGLLLREPDGRIDHIYLRRFSRDSSTPIVIVIDAHSSGEQLVLLTQVSPSPIQKEQPAPPHGFWRLTYDIPPDDGRERRLLPSAAERLGEDPYWASFRNGADDWVAFQHGFQGSLTAGQTLITSDGASMRLPGLVDLPATASTPCRKGLVINGRDEIAVLHIPHNQPGAEFILLPLDGSEQSAREPLKLPIENMNTWIRGQTSNGRYALVHGKGIRNSLLWLKRIHPSFDHYTVRDDLALIDLHNWQVVATFSHTSRSFQTSRSAIRNPTFSHDDQHMLVPSGRSLIKVNIQDWIDACR